MDIPPDIMERLAALRAKHPPPLEDVHELIRYFPGFSLPFLPLYVDDMFGGTQMMDATEYGAYNALLHTLWNNKCRPLPNDPKVLRRVSRVKRNWGSVWAAIQSKFEVDENGVWNRKLDQVYRISAVKSLIIRRASVLGGEANSLKYNNPPPAEGGAEGGANPEPRGGNTSVLPHGAVRDEKSAAKTSRKKTAKRLPEGWVPDMTKARDLMAELGLERSEMNYCYQQMRDHAHATDRRQADWDAAFRQWVRKSARDGEVGKNRNGQSGGEDQSAFPDV